MAFKNQREIERLALPADKAEAFHFDARCPGLSIRLQRHGKPAYVVWYTLPGGKRKRITLGAVAGMELDDARRQATNTVNAARDGRDPGLERKQARVAAATALPLGDLIKAYLRDHAAHKQRPRSLAETKRALERHWAPLHSLPAAAVTLREVSARLIELADSNGPVAANRARANLSAAFTWAMRAGLVGANPTIAAVKNEEVSRDRVLMVEELAAIWRATSDLTSYDAIVRLLMLTWARRLEVGGMAHAEIEGSTWNLPAARCKSWRAMQKRGQAAHEIPLSRQAQAIIAEFPELPERPFVFGRGGRSPFSGWSQCKARLDERIARQRAEQRLGRELGDGEEPEPGDFLKAWRLHDLRRSGVTLAAEHEVAEPHVIEAVVNHAGGHRAGVAGVYNRAPYREAKRIALQRWSDWLLAKFEGKEPASNVRVLRKAG
jgi:Arm DNA-binding domain